MRHYNLHWLRAIAYTVFKLSLLGFIILEVFLRINYTEQLKRRHYPLIYESDTELGYRYIPGVESHITAPCIDKKISINPDGYLGPLYPPEKPDSVYRIVIIGTSQSSGIWSNGEAAFPEKLEQKLRAAHCNAQVLNFSSDGRYRDLQNIKMGHKVVQTYQPDLLLLNTDMPFVEGYVHRTNYRGYVIIYSHDPGSFAYCQQQIDFIRKHFWFDWLYRAAYSVRAVTKRYYENHNDQWATLLETYTRKRMQAPDCQFIPWASNTSANKITELADSLHKQDGELFVFQYGEDPFFERISEIYGINYWELAILDSGQFHHSFDSHYNDEGHDEVAEKLFQKLSHPQPEDSLPNLNLTR